MPGNYYIPYEQALKLVLENAPTMPSQRVHLLEALGRVLATDVRATRDNPPERVSAMDGYGVCIENLKELPTKLKIVGEIPAGVVPRLRVEKDTAVKLFTGSIIPPGCDAVIPVECAKENNGELTIEKIPRKGENIREKGEDYREGDIILKKGEIITPAEMGILASINKSIIKVSVKPRVGIITTGNEIVELGESLEKPSQIINSNAYTLYGLVKEAGGEPLYLGVCPDSKEKTKEKLEEALNLCDIVLTSGGVSAGNYDFVKEVIEELGIKRIFYKIRVKPGKPLLFGKKGKKFLFALPGFPVSTVVSFLNFVFPFIRKALGANEIFKKRVKATLKKSFRRGKADRLEFARCKLSYDLEKGCYFALPSKRQGSGILSELKGNTGLMVIPVGIRELKEGSQVEVILLKEGIC
jgi:molybdopterin molybdotransferase